MKMTLNPLAPPNTPPGLPNNLARGGVMDAPWIPPENIDQSRRVVPTDSPPMRVVPDGVFRMPVSFAPSDSVREITGRPGSMGSSDPLYGARGDKRGGIFLNHTPRTFQTIRYQDVPMVRTTDYRMMAGYGQIPQAGPAYTNVPMARTTDYVMMSGYGSPDGLGGCGGCGGWG